MTQLAGRGKSSRDVVHRAKRAVVVGLMAGHAGGTVELIVPVDMAVGALARRNGVHSGQGESGGRVIERGIGPQDGVMTLLASLRKARLRVIRRRGALVVLKVTTHAGSRGQVVVVVDVAIGAEPRRTGVRAGEYKPGRGVIKSRIQPGRRVVTLFAGLREVRRDVVRIGGALVILQMASHASGIGQVVIVADMAVAALARWNRVHAGQRKADQVVIERCIRPGNRVMALVASLGEFPGHVIGIGGALVVLQVAGDASRADQIVVVVDVAVRALPRRHGMRAGQRKSDGTVIELCVGPIVEAVTLFTGDGKLARNVIGIQCLLIILRVARITGCG